MRRVEPVGARARRAYASFTIAITAPASTQTTIATCIQIHVGGITASVAPPGAQNLFQNERRVGWRRIVDAGRRTRAQSMLKHRRASRVANRRRETVPAGRRAF
jgi:hypothetical protein